MKYGIYMLMKIFDRKFNYKYRQSIPQNKMNVLRFSDYDCIGFDLDSTIIKYNVKNLVQLAYNLITNFLISNRGYDEKCFNEPLTKKDWDFMQNGLFCDFEKGNILKLNSKGEVHTVSHGTRFLTSEEISEYYPDRIWKYSAVFRENPLIVRNGPLSHKMESLLTCFDMPVSIIFAKAVDAIDKKYNKALNTYKIFPDIWDAIIDMYARKQLKNGSGNFYSELKDNPEKYIYKCSPEVLTWIQKIKKEKKTFLVTSSNSDFVELTTNYAFNEDLKSLFDIIVCYARKPGFFTKDRPFYTIKDYYEDKIVTSEQLEIGEIYNQGNWKDLNQFLSRISGVQNPKCLYFGDNLLEDVYAPTISGCCDTVAIIAEQSSEDSISNNSDNDDDILNSKLWDSYFILKNDKYHEPSFWNYMIKKYSKICIPDLQMIIDDPLDKPFECFNDNDDNNLDGYHPKPNAMQNVQ